jgi:hypothetical protein
VLAQLHELEADGAPVTQAAAAAEQGVSSQAGPLLAGTGRLAIKLPATGQPGQVLDLRGWADSACGAASSSGSRARAMRIDIGASMRGNVRPV